ncbi:HTH-type transcriptional repressor PurR [anaerobic digester metagenome]
MKKFLSVLLSATLVLGLTACGGSKPAAEGEKPSEGDSAKKELTLGFIVGSREHVFYNLIEEGIMTASKDLGFKAIVLDGELDSNVTSDHINNLVAQGVDAIALSCNDPGGTTPAMEAADKEGIPVFTFDCTSDVTDVVKCFVGTDNVEGGRLGGQETVRLAEAGKTVGIINFDEPQSCIDRRTGWEEIVKASDKKLNIIDIGNYEGDAAKAEQLMSDALSANNNDIAVVFAVGDPAATGALAAIKAAGADTKIIGFDGNPEAKAAILDAENGKFWVSEISQNPMEIGKQISKNMVDYLNNGSVTEAKIMIAPYIITAENAAE